MEKIFGQSGLIAQNHTEYEYRSGQIKMAEACLRAFEERRHLIVEAGTGTGKTLAYLVPAIAFALAEKKRVIISTGTKNLQEQLMEKDIPFLQKVLPKKFTAAYMKGRGNYVCLQKTKKAEHTPILSGLDDVDYFEEIRHWARESNTGDRAELVDMPENLSFWRFIDARSETCLGQKCPEFEPCFITRMRQRASDADIVIVNHHLFFADLSLRGDTNFGRVLPDYAAVVFDEAHLIEDIAADYFGAQVSSYQIEELVRDIGNLTLTDVQTNRDLMKISSRIIGFSDRFWLGFRSKEEGRFPIVPNTFKQERSGETVVTPLGEAFLALDKSLERMETALDAASAGSAEIENLVRRARQIRFDLDFICSGADGKFVYWLERRGRGTFLRASPIDVSGLLEDKLFDKTETVILTSATLSTNNSFNFVRERLGLEEEKTDDFIAPSSFDYEKQAVLYLPPKMPDPRSPDFLQVAAGEIIKILEITEGRAFVLATSNAAMKALYERVAPRLDYPCLVQGMMSKAGLLEKFRKTPNAVLFATSSFWQGVDVRGEQLSCVIIDKLPFAVPTDPIVAARQRFIDQQGGSSFFEYSVPQAAISLKQGIGRLIRSATDRGVLAILDPRLTTKGYGKVFINSLPKMKITSNLAEVSSIFNVTTGINDENPF
ncbi:MAG TPA: helicase C-terminal domain-containing protein [Pyrinomonadaceae bacterium]|nr:helicase C-terminal domain-containing protein [Pyrinomonadaceae bacterium]